MKIDISIKKISILLAIFAFSFAAAEAQVAGALDLTFGTGGKATTKVGDFGTPNAIAVQPDGKIIVAGTDGNNWAAVRYNQNGTLDTGFGSGSRVTLAINSSVYGIHIQTDGKIVLAGDTTRTVNNADAPCFGLARINPNGSLDTTYSAGGGGFFCFNSTGLFSATASVSQTDGKIIITGFITRADGTTDSVLVRFTSNGLIDTSFNSTGAAVINFGVNDEIRGAALQSDGKIVVIGNIKDQGTFVARLNQTGALDTSFGTGGRVGRSGNFAGSDVVVQPDGRIVAGSYESANQNFGDKFIVERFNADGTFDAAFGTGGRTATTVDSSALPTDVLLQADGKIVLTGQSGDEGRFTLVRYNSNGTLDTSFGNSGIVKTSFGNNSPFYALKSALQPDGKIVAAGFTINFDTIEQGFAVARYLSVAQAPADPVMISTATGALTLPFTARRTALGIA